MYNNGPMTYSDRTTSAFPLSIGTSMAFESLFKGVQPSYDATREIPQMVDYSKYDIIYINLKTLLRNIIGSLSLDDQKAPNTNTLYNTLVNEIEIITNILRTDTNNLLKPLFYYTGYPSLKELSRKKVINLRTSNTEKQKIAEVMEEKILDHVFKLRNVYSIEKSTIHDLRVKNLRALIITHIPFDLLGYKRFKQLDLLESHTGKLKHFNQFNSKYFPVPNVNMDKLPFNFFLLAILGDKVMFKPYPMKIREAVMEVSNKKKWTPLTNNIKVKGDIIGANIDTYLPMFINSLPEI